MWSGRLVGSHSVRRPGSARWNRSSRFCECNAGPAAILYQRRDALRIRTAMNMRTSIFSLLTMLVAGAVEPARSLRVCSDPNNLPFSNQNRGGFENKIAEMLARDLDVKVEYAWWAQRKNFVDKTLRAGICDVIVGLPSSFPGVLTTQPYYRSSYVFVYRKDTGVQLRSLNDAALSRLRIGIHVVDADLAPPAQLLARRGIVQNVKGYSLFGSYGEPNPPAKIIEAVRKREIDVAIVWGPLAGYFGRDLVVAPVRDTYTGPSNPLTFDISIAVRAADLKLKEQLQGALDHHRTDVTVSSQPTEYHDEAARGHHRHCPHVCFRLQARTAHAAG